MNEATQEQLSALLDGELPADELRFLLRRLDLDADLARRWSRYQVVSAVLRREPAALRLRPDFAAAVLTRLDAEPAAAPRRPLGMRVLRWAGGGAIAASVAVVALVASRPPAPDNGSATPAPLVAATNAAPAAATVGQLRQPLLPMPTAFADYTTPASFDSIIPNYAAPRPANSGGNEAFVPYVLVVVPRQSLQQQPAPRQDAPPQQ